MSTALSTTGASAQTANDNWRLALHRAGAALRAGTVVESPTFDFSPLPNQPRKYFNPDAMQHLTDSMKSPLGQMTEGLARLAPPGAGTKYQIIDGERRWRAARIAEIPYRARIIDVDDNTLPYIIAAVANFNRESLTVTDVVNAIDFLIKHGAPWSEISQMIGASVQWLQKLYTLKKLTDEVWNLMDPNRPQAKVLGTMAAIEIAKLHRSQQLPLATRVLEHKLTTAAVKHATLQAIKKSDRTPRRAPRKTWRSVMNRIGVLDRTTNDLEIVLAGEGADEIFVGRSNERIQELIEQLQRSIDRGANIRRILMNNCIVAPDVDAEELEDARPVSVTP